MEKKNITSISKEFCCGCSACAAICPVDAIEMKLDQHGFYYPMAQADCCIDCGQCLNVCVHK